MPRIDVKAIGKDNYAYKKNTINYVARNDHCIEGYIGATNLLLDKNRNKNATEVLKQMEEAREFYNQTDTRQGLHVVFTFSPKEAEHLTKKDALKLAYEVAETEFEGCMTYFAVHDNTSLIHIDMLVDPLNVYTGKMYGCHKAGWWSIGNRFIERMKLYVPEEDIGELQIPYGKE